MENMENSEKQVKKFSIIGVIILSVLLSAVTGAFFGFMAAGLGSSIFPKLSEKMGWMDINKNAPQTEIKKETVIQEDSAVIDVVEKSSVAVVSIIISKDVPKYRSFFDDPFNFYSPFRAEGELETEKQKVGGGSGFLISKDGTIITNKHVVSDVNAEYTVVTNDGKEWPAKIVSQHPALDVALIKVDGNDFSFLEFSDSNSLKVGQTAIAIGNSLGEFANSVSRGIISGLQRNITAGSGFGDTERLTNIIQTDAAINPGNSGGPLLNIDGKVIGVNVAVAQGAENIGFALPSNQVKKFIEQVKAKGKVSIPYIGVRYIIIDESIQKENNLPFNYGALVLRGEKMTDFAVIPGSPADKAGITENDIILEVADKKVTQEDPLSDFVSKYEVGDELTFKIWHKGETKDAKVKLEERK